VATRIQLRRGNAASWTEFNPILSSGELGIESDTNLIKIGNGSANWDELPYFLDAEILSASSNLVDYVDSQLEALVNLSPETLDTLGELAEAINNDPDFFANISETITSASAYALSEANDYTDSASASLIEYVDLEIGSASASLIDYTDQEISALEVFSNIVTNPETETIEGDSNSDTLTFDAGSNIILSASASTDTLNISLDSELTGIDSISAPDYIQFDTTANVNPVTGLLGWDSVEGTLNLGLSSTKHIHLGEEAVYRVRNSTGSTIGKGTALYASGVEPSGRIQVTPYVADGSVREVRFMGLATESISSGVNGFVQHFGYIRDLDTRGTSSTSISVGDETWAAGDLLYVHPTVPGKLTNVKPQHEIVVAIIIIRHQSTGILFVRPTSGGHLEDIHDISLSSLSNEDILVYNNSASIWENESLQDYLTSASAAAFASASAYTDSEISSLIGDAPELLDTLQELAAALQDNPDILDTFLTQSSASTIYSQLGHTHTASEITDFVDETIEEVSTLFIHNNHNNLTAEYNEESGQIILSASGGGGGGGASIIVSPTAPEGAVEGDAWFKSTDGSFYVFDGTFWVETASDGAGSADMDSFTRWNKTYSGSATVIEGVDEDGLPLLYTPGLEQLFINGILIDEANYTATSGSTIVLSDAVLNNDVVEIFSIRSFNIANVYTKEESDALLDNLDSEYEVKRNVYIVEDYTASNNDIIFVDTSASAHTVTLPSSPSLGEKVLIADLADNAGTNNIIVNRNSSKIDGVEENFLIDINNGKIEFIYTNSTYGWRTI
jgi:hypothetical protein